MLTPAELEFERYFLLGNLPLPLVDRPLNFLSGHTAAMLSAYPSYEQLVALEDVRVTASPQVVAGLARKILGGQGRAEGVRESVCLVCHEDFEEGEEVLCLQCSHSFHTSCGLKWLQVYSNKCPVCKAYVA
jgi:hypothetical protein